MRTRSDDATLEIRNVNFRIKDKDILNNIYTTAKNGQILAIMGPTGSGKTTLLNVISGRQKPTSGTITLNDKPFNKTLRRRLAFVQQEDVFFSQLTLLETLQFSANMRLPESMSQEEKMAVINIIVDELDLRKCLNTVIGDTYVKGLSGGEKKRASIACELLVDSDIMLLDEPTSGLDSCTAYAIMKCIETYTQRYNKMFILTIHQPSSRIYHMFDQLLLLVEGNIGYNDSRLNVLPFFEDLGYYCEHHYNPADFLAELLKSDQETIHIIVSKAASSRNLTNRLMNLNAITDNKVVQAKVDDDLDEKGDYSSAKLLQNGNGIHEYKVKIDKSKHKCNAHEEVDKWPTCWFTQYKTLSWRSLKQTIGVLKQGFTLIQIISVAILSCLVYVGTGVSLEKSRDLFGLIYFCTGYVTFLPAFAVISSFPAERKIINKERASGAYRLSAYYLAKLTSDLPEVLLQPGIMFTVFYWVGGFGGGAEYVICLLMMMLQVFACFGLGLLISALMSDIRKAVTTLFSGPISMYLFGGFFTQSMPSWIEWIKYLSLFYYPYSFCVSIIMPQMPLTLCNSTDITRFPKCQYNNTDFVTSRDLLASGNIYWPSHYYLAVVLGYTLFIRGGSYIVLRLNREVPV